MMTAALHLHNAQIWTGYSGQPRASSVTVVGGRVIALDAEAPAGAAVIDAAGRTVAPGLSDAHVHLLVGGQSLTQLDLSGVRSRAQFEQAIAQRHGRLPSGRWLIANGWSQENWPGHAMPDKSWLAAAGERPVVCYRMDLHAAVVNDAVLALCDLSRDPLGGRIERDQVTGEPTGLMLEAAAWNLVNPVVPSVNAEQRRDALLAAQEHAHRYGLTTVGTMEYARDVERVYLPLRDRLTLRCRVTLLDRAWPMDFDFGRDFPDDDRLAVIGYKAYLDGTLGSRTARMLEDYADDPGNRGMLVELAADGRLRDWALAVAASGLSPSMHAIGDEAIRLALDVVEAIDPDRRPRIEHAQQIAASDIARFGGSHRESLRGRGRIASMQPLHKADDGRYARDRVGDVRLAGTFAFRSLLDVGARLAFGSDWPVVSCDPMAGMQAAITGRTLDGEVCLPEQNLTVEEALRAYTADAGYCLGLDDVGVLRPGAAGDLVMFDRDPFAADWDRSPPRILLTVVAGNVVHHETA